MYLTLPTAQMWRKAEEKAASHKGKERVLSSTGESMVPYLTRENVQGYVVYPGDAGGWIADVAFRVPFGLPDRVGTSVATPFRTKREARDSVVGTLVMAILNSMANLTPSGKFVFEFCDLAVPVELECVSEIRAQAQRAGVVVNSSEVRAMLTVAETMLHADPDQSLGETIHAIWSAVHAACCVGITCWPEPQPRSPSGHAMASMMQ
jgi:hypothetical protein